MSINYGYYAKISARKIAWSLRVNDIYVRESADVAASTSAGSITLAMQPGQNQISMLFAPSPSKDVTGQISHTLDHGMELEIVIERLDFATRESQEIDAIRLYYDTEEGQFRDHLNMADGRDRILVRPGLRMVDGYQITELAAPGIVFRSGETVGGYRLDFDIATQDQDLAPFHWAGKATVLEDNPALRQELTGAYEWLHGLVSSGDARTIESMAMPVWDRVAAVLTEQPNGQAYYQQQGGPSLWRPTRPSGARLLPLRFEDPQSVQFMAQNRLVRFRPDPIIWEKPPAGSESLETFPVVLYRGTDGVWRIADIITGL